MALALARRRQGLLHRRRSRRCRTRSTPTWLPALGAGAGRAAHRGQRHQRRRPGGGDDHRGAAQHDLRRVARPGRPAVRRARRGPLPPGRLPGPGVGGGASIHLPPRGAASCACRPRCPTPTELADWIAHGAGPDRDGGRARARPVELEPCTSWATGRRTVTTCCRLLVDGRPNPEGAPLRRRAAPPAGPAPPARAARRVLHAAPGGGHRAARRRGPAAGHLLHLQPRRRATTPSRTCLDAGLRLTDAGRAAPDPPARRGTDRRPDRRRPGRARATTAGWPALEAGRRRPPRRDGPAVQGGGGGLLRRGPGQGGVRHRDPGPRHQHAGPLGRDRAAHQVQRRAPRVPDARAVHPAHRAGRAAGHRRPAATPSCCGRRSCPSTRWRRWPPAASSPCASAFRPTYNMAANLVRPLRPRAGAPAPRPVLRPVPGRPRRRSASRPVPTGWPRTWPQLEAGRTTGRRSSTWPATRSWPSGSVPPGDAPRRPRRHRGVAVPAPSR